MPVRPKLSLIIVKYRSQEYLPKCLASIEKNPLWEIIIVDNDKENIGYGPACNKGAQKAKGEYLLFLNPDTVVLPGSLEKMIEYLDRHPEVGILGPQLLSEKSEIVPSSSAIPTPLMAIFSFTFLAKVSKNNHWSREYWYQGWDRKSEKEVGAVSGAALIIRKNLFEKLGGFDEKFFLYFEEVDLCERVEEAGFRVVFCPHAKVIHYGGKSTEKGEKIDRIFSKSRFYFFQKHSGWPGALAVHFFASLRLFHLGLFIIIIAGALLRLYQLLTLAPFSGDQGRDLLVAKDIFINHQFPVVGPQTSVPRLYLGPIFYYFSAIALFLGNFHPAAASFLCALFGIGAIYLIYAVGKKYFNRQVGLLAACLLAFSPFAVIFSRIGLHPSPLPFFLLIFFLGLKRKNFWLTFVSFIIAAQLHLSAILLLPIWLLVTLSGFKKTLFSAALFLVILALIFLKEIRGSPFTPFSYWTEMLTFMLSPGNLFLAITLIFFALSAIHDWLSESVRPLFYWLVLGIIGLTIKNSQAEHYFNFILPPVCLFLACGWERLRAGRRESLAWSLATVFIAFNLYQLLSANFFIAKYGPPLSARIAVAKFIVNDAHGQPFSLRREGPLWDLPSTNKNYEYLLWWLGNPPQKEAQYLSYTIYEPKEAAQEFKIKGKLVLFDYSAVEVEKND